MLPMCVFSYFPQTALQYIVHLVGNLSNSYCPRRFSLAISESESGCCFRHSPVNSRLLVLGVSRHIVEGGYGASWTELSLNHPRGVMCK